MLKFSYLSWLLLLSVISCNLSKNPERKETSLNGVWNITESLSEEIPGTFPSTVSVPGLVDMAIPAFDSIGVKCQHRNYFWYRRTFDMPAPFPEVLLLKINKAAYGAKVYINRKEAGYNPFCFTSNTINIKSHLKEGKNEILIRVGAFRDNIPDSISSGFDFEKSLYIPGIYDNVTLIQSGYPYISHLQIAPDINKDKVIVLAEVITDNNIDAFQLQYNIQEYKSGKKIKNGHSIKRKIYKDSVNIIQFEIDWKDYQLWTPENPFLYNFNVSTEGDSRSERFGMRSFAFDPERKCAVLNGKPYAMLGTNVCIFRFFEDPSRQNLPWDDRWVKKLHQTFKTMNWNSIRYCIGFPPESWYQIADEEGFLIQDEYPFWYLFEKSTVTQSTLIEEYTRWIRERGNHPSVVIWDAQNESVSGITGPAMQIARETDLSDRPCDNGWDAPMRETDCIESHPYLFSKYWNTDELESPKGFMKEFYDTVRLPGNDPNKWSPPDSGRYDNAVIINEYDWLWLNRNGSTTTLTDRVYSVLWGDSLTTDQRRALRAEHVGILTEYWRCNRKAAAIMHFCGLGYSRHENPRGQTSDDFIDIKNLTFEPLFFKEVKNKFAPIALMIQLWDKALPENQTMDVPIVMISDYPNPWEGILYLTLMDNKGKETTQQKSISLDPHSQMTSTFTITTSFKESFKMKAWTVVGKDTVSSIRDFSIKTGKD